MKLKTVVRDCLYLNWALPLAALPELPAPLTYEKHEAGGEAYAFASALLFRQQGLRLAALALPRLSYPQLNLRYYVFDGEGVPAVFFDHMLVPPWVVPVVRYLARQPVASGWFDYPEPSRRSGEESWSWRVKRRGALELEARLAAPAVGQGPAFSSWESAVSYFRRRPRGYARGRGGGLRRIATSQPQVATWPMAVEIGDTGLLERRTRVRPWPALHSAFLCPEIPFVFELGLVPEAVRRSPRPVAADPAMLRRADGRRAAA